MIVLIQVNIAAGYIINKIVYVNNDYSITCIINITVSNGISPKQFINSIYVKFMLRKSLLMHYLLKLEAACMNILPGKFRTN